MNTDLMAEPWHASSMELAVRASQHKPGVVQDAFGEAT